MKNMAVLLCFISFGVFSQKQIPLYPNGAPEGILSENAETAYGVEFITNVSNARLYVYLAKKPTKSGTSVLICPGGGYGGLAAEKEGVEIAKWFIDNGISAFVLYYRMPFQHPFVPLSDTKKAMSIIKHNAHKWRINKTKIGVIGFSAGGHLAATLATHYDRSTKPYFLALVYPVISFREMFAPGGTCNNLIGNNPTENQINFFSAELHVTPKTPPSFIVHAADDNVVEFNHSQAFADSLGANGVKHELIIYKKGGHGFGMRKQGCDADTWPNRLKEWLIINKFIQKL